ncbi:hypothetical protein BDW69DRAFT_144847 [Aspergillus filifer]
MQRRRRLLSLLLSLSLLLLPLSLSHCPLPNPRPPTPQVPLALSCTIILRFYALFHRDRHCLALLLLSQFSWSGGSCWRYSPDPGRLGLSLHPCRGFPTLVSWKGFRSDSRGTTCELSKHQLSLVFM